jgi:hypothetical protein
MADQQKESTSTAAEMVPKPGLGSTSNPVANQMPEGFPARKELEAAGYTDPGLLRGMRRDELAAIEGIGEARAKEVAEALRPQRGKAVDVEVVRPSGFPYGGQGGVHAFGTRLSVPEHVAAYHEGTFLQRVGAKR